MTVDQRDIESRAIGLLASDAVQRGRERVTARWRAVVGSGLPDEAWALFDEMVDEFTFNYVLKASALDPERPAVLAATYAPPHQWFGMDVPGSRAAGGVGADQHYALIPVRHGLSYNLTGRRLDPVPADIPLTVIGNDFLTMTLNSLDLTNVTLADDRTYSVGVGLEDRPGDPNYIQTRPGARWLLLRETRSDWGQVPSALRVDRVGKPSADPWSDKEVADLACAIMVDDVAPAYGTIRVFDGLPLNTVPPLFNTGVIGGLVSQQVLFARLRLERDDAYVCTVGTGEAAYHSLMLYDHWLRTIDYPTRQSTLNNTQAVPNPDGSITYVVAHDDPGVANWLDPVGLAHINVVGRWQRLRSEPSATGQLIKVADLDAVVAADVPRVTKAERIQQLANRHESYLLRFTG
jgi:hypothetical protein